MEPMAPDQPAQPFAPPSSWQPGVPPTGTPPRRPAPGRNRTGTRRALDEIAQLGYAVSLAVAFLVAVALGVLWAVIINSTNFIPLWLTAVTGLAIGTVAGAPGRRVNVAVGLAAGAFAAISAVIVAYLCGRSQVIDMLGASYKVPFWTGLHEAQRIITAMLKANGILVAADIGSVLLAVFAGSGLWRRWRPAAYRRS